MNDFDLCRADVPAVAASDVAYLDHAATTQVPRAVMEAQQAFLLGGRGNPGRGSHRFAVRAETALLEARQAIAAFAQVQEDQLVLTKGTTEGLNILAAGLGAGFAPEDEVIVAHAAHHAQLLPWRRAAACHGFRLGVAPHLSDGTLDLAALRRLVTPRTRVIALPWVSNVTGIVFPLHEVTEIARSVHALVLIDAAQAAAHLPFADAADVDALVWGAHKMYGPMGIGALTLSPRVRDVLPPLLWGGGMVEEVTEEGEISFPGVAAFAAGTPNVEGAVGFAAACAYVREHQQRARVREQELTARLIAGLLSIPGVSVAGADVHDRVGILSFMVAGVHPHDVAQAADDAGIAVRAGLHCAALHTRAICPRGTVRVSMGFPTTAEDIDRLLAVVRTYAS